MTIDSSPQTKTVEAYYGGIRAFMNYIELRTYIRSLFKININWISQEFGLCGGIAQFILMPFINLDQKSSSLDPHDFSSNSILLN